MELNKNVNKEYDLPCQLCDNQTTHIVLASADTLESTPEITVSEEFQIVQCRGCKKISFRSNWQSDNDVSHIPTKREDGSQDWETVYDDHEELFPSRVTGRKPLRESYFLPTDIEKIYKETHLALCSKQPILAAIGIRAIIEAVCKEKKAKGGNLEKKIDDLVTMGDLTKRGADGLHSTRLLGNTSAHEIIALPEKNLDIGMDIVENLLMNVYILPHKAESLPKRK